MAEITIEYKIRGLEPLESEFFSGIEAEIRKTAEVGVRHQIESMACPVHGQGPTVSFENLESGWKYDIQGCCEILTGEVNKKFGAPKS